MSQEIQVVVPRSFADLFVKPGRLRPMASAAKIAARHEVCEDLAVLVTAHVKTVLWSLSITQGTCFNESRRDSWRLDLLSRHRRHGGSSAGWPGLGWAWESQSP